MIPDSIGLSGHYKEIWCFQWTSADNFQSQQILPFLRWETTHYTEIWRIYKRNWLARVFWKDCFHLNLLCNQKVQIQPDTDHDNNSGLKQTSSIHCVHLQKINEHKMWSQQGRNIFPGWWLTLMQRLSDWKAPCTGRSGDSHGQRFTPFPRLLSWSL